METKVCSKCKIEKPLSEFHKRTGRKSGIQSRCIECKKQYIKDNKERISLKKKEWREKNKEEENRKERQRYLENIEKERERSKKYYRENKEKISLKQKKYREENKQKIKERNKKYTKNNQEKIQQYHKEYNKKPEVRKRKNKEERKKRKNDINFKLRKNVSRSISKALKQNNGGKKGGSVLNHLPFSIQQLKEHLEKQFDDKMTWENSGTYWHIDHIIPHSFFNYKSMDCEEFQKCWSLENLRPLEAKENIKKSNKLIK